MSKIPIHSRGSLRRTAKDNDAKSHDSDNATGGRESASTSRSFKRSGSDAQRNTVKDINQHMSSTQLNRIIEKEHSNPKKGKGNGVMGQRSVGEGSFVYSHSQKTDNDNRNEQSSDKGSEIRSRQSNRKAILSPSAQNKVIHEKHINQTDVNLNKTSPESIDSPAILRPVHIESNDFSKSETCQQEEEQDDFKQTSPQKGTVLRKSVETKHIYSRPKSEIRHSTPQNIASVKRPGSLPESRIKQSSPWQDTEMKQVGSQRESPRQQRIQENTKVTASSSRQNSKAEQTKRKQSTESMQKLSLQETQAKQNKSRQNTEANQNSSRQIKGVKTTNSKQTVDVKSTDNDKTETDKNVNPTSPTKTRDIGAKQLVTDRNAMSPRKHSKDSLVSSRQNLKSKSRQSTFEGNNERTTKDDSLIDLYATEDDKDDAYEWPDVRGITPSKTSFSRHNTRVASRGDARSRNSGTGEAHEHTGSGTRPSSEVAPMVLTSSADPEINETVSIAELKAEEPEEGSIQCSYCEMTFKSKAQLEVHKSKLCLGVSQPAELYDLVEGKDFFIVGNGNVVHSTPRGWSVSNKGSVRTSRDGTLDDYCRVSVPCKCPFLFTDSLVLSNIFS